MSSSDFVAGDETEVPFATGCNFANVTPTEPKSKPSFQSHLKMQQTFRFGAAGSREPDMPSITATPSDRPCRPHSLDYGDPVEVIYRRHFPDIATAPVLLVALMLALAMFEHVRIGSIPPLEGVVLSVVGPFLVALSSLWAMIVWYGTHVCLDETMLSFHEMGVFFKIRARTVPWAEIKDVSLSDDDLLSWRRSVVLTLNEGGSLLIKDIPEPEYLYRHIKTKLSR